MAGSTLTHRREGDEIALAVHAVVLLEHVKAVILSKHRQPVSEKTRALVDGFGRGSRFARASCA